MGVNNSGELEVSYHGLDETATQLANHARRLEESLEAIQHKVASVASMWEGEAHHAYTEQQAAWDREAKGIHEALAAIGRVVHAAGGDYQGGDRKAASYFM
ncbi:WXG100 family type VII secretion target [Streptomyces pluripotens]|uniref:ESAT-6-like protein n=1 Tax=Streptomyces pluripotens TaxID=1355015 RepID=A0A221P3P6_9ACTN|nr:MULTISPECIES: WXG100 family type VII secretion target [Streptomyces]ARP72639.1 WXG100 family type VII secretion target [Streptomyces pluripotens]ASN26893.1 WXG100 family type VII secretion target [Streptomyces pluripotens]KIE23494.1 early secretory antigenic target [Streptomyces sp. MUSC 125]MCH0560863.1 WXG100 family type VII secretion target [Streptomyces sp. MUM 16J]